MAKRRKRFTQTSTPRFRAKMYDYLSRGGRIPSVIALEVADAVTTEWSQGFGSYESFKKRVVFPTLSNLGIPYIIRGIIVGQAMKVYKKFGENPTREAVESIAKEVEFDKISYNGITLERILLAIFGHERLSATTTAGEEKGTEVPQS